MSQNEYLEKIMISQIESNYDDLITSLKSIISKKDIPIFADKLYKNYSHYLDILNSLEQRKYYFDEKDSKKYDALGNAILKAKAIVQDENRKQLLEDLLQNLLKFFKKYKLPPKRKSTLSNYNQTKSDEMDFWDKARKTVLGDLNLPEIDERKFDETILFGGPTESKQEDIYEKIDLELIQAIDRLYQQAEGGFYRELGNTIREKKKTENLSKNKEKLSALDKASILALAVEEQKFAEQ